MKCRGCGHVVQDEGVRLEPVPANADRASPSWALAMSDEDGDAIEAIANLMGSGGASLHEMDVSDVPMRELIARHGPPPSCLRGFIFPAYCWPMSDEAGHAAWLVVIDQGHRRVSFRTRRRGVHMRP